MPARLGLVVLLGVLSAFGPLSIDLYLPGLPRLTSDFDTSASAGQLTLAACILGLAFGQLVAGPVSDRFGRRPPLLAGLTLYCAASVACAVASSVWLLVGFRLVQGLSGAAGIVIARSIVRDLHSGVAAARMFSVLMLVLGSVPVIAPVVGGQLLRVVSWRGVFLVLAGVDAVILAAVAFTLHETLPPERRRRAGGTVSGLLELLRDRLFLAYAVVLGLAGAEVLSYIAGSSFVLQDLYGVSPQLYGAIFGLNALGIIVCSQLNRALLGRVSPERLLGTAVVAGASAGSTLLGVVLTGVGLPGILPCLFVVVASIGVVVPNAAALALTDYPHAAGSASALLGAFQFAFGGAAAPLIGAAGRGTAVPMALVIALFGAGALVASVLARRTTPLLVPVSAGRIGSPR